MRNEVFLSRTEKRVREEHGPALAHQIFVFRMRQGRFNDGHRYRLVRLAKVPGFSGSIALGVPVNKERLDKAAPTSDIPEISTGFDAMALGDDDEDDDEEEANTLADMLTVLRVTEDMA
ncbi:hypothetical protein C8R44DRAFT_738133 [Mycena epipterygia]|nr:hypothetical protein C8R44DRAFT_738133 [Mycena epipterygia]